MSHKTLSILVVSLAAFLATPTKTWAETPEEQAARIGGMCEIECKRYTDALERGGQRPAYEAAACTYMCFFRNHSDHPNRDEWLEKAKYHAREARKLGSRYPIPVSP